MITGIVQWLCGPSAELSQSIDRCLLRRIWTKQKSMKKMSEKKQIWPCLFNNLVSIFKEIPSLDHCWRIYHAFE